MNKNLVFLILCMALVFSATPASAEGWVEFFFPTLKSVEPDPAETLTAPFAEDAGANKIVKPALPENETSLEYPHRNAAQIGEWVVIAVSEAMTFEKQNYQQSINESSRHFSESGKQQYLTFLQDNSILRVLESGKFHIRSFVQETPVLLNEGPVEGRYRWLYEVPVMASYMDRNMKDYDRAASPDQQPVNQRVSLTIQVGRTGSREPGKDIAIERWTGKVENISK